MGAFKIKQHMYRLKHVLTAPLKKVKEEKSSSLNCSRKHKKKHSLKISLLGKVLFWNKLKVVRNAQNFCSPRCFIFRSGIGLKIDYLFLIIFATECDKL